MGEIDTHNLKPSFICPLETEGNVIRLVGVVFLRRVSCASNVVCGNDDYYVQVKVRLTGWGFGRLTRRRLSANQARLSHVGVILSLYSPRTPAFGIGGATDDVLVAQYTVCQRSPLISFVIAL